ncbi:MAG: carbohydrate ABC transporter permease [Spirochaetaceae bacterium]
MLRRRVSDTIIAYVFLAPALFVLFMFQYRPAFNIFRTSLTNQLLLRPTSQFVGLTNYERLFQDERFWNSVRNTFYFVGASVPIQIGLALLLALALARVLKRTDFFRTVFFLPVAGSLVALSVIWEWIYHPRLGALNGVLSVFGAPRIDWLLDPFWAMPSLVLLVVWTGTGYYMIIYVAGLLDIGKEYYEAARIDGANRVQSFVYITWPLLAPTTYLILILQVINSFQVFTTVFVMTGGGPARTTEVLVFYLYQRAFESMEFGYASTIAVVLFTFLVTLTIVLRHSYGNRVSYER